MKFIKKCLVCGKAFEKPESCGMPEWNNKRKFCCKECADKFRRGKPSWNSGKKTGIKTDGCFKKGHSPWNKNTKGIVQAWNKGKKMDNEWQERVSKLQKGRKQSKEEIEKRIKKFTGEKHYLWKGEKVGYYALHSWVKRHKGKPKKCVDCGITSDQVRIHWSNIDHKYRRNLDDYVARCNGCHKEYDFKMGFIKSIGRY